MNGPRATLRHMNPTRSLVLLASALALPLLLSPCGNKGPLVRATPVPASIDGTPTIDAPVEGEAVPAEDATVEEAAIDDTDPSDEIVLPEDEAPAESEVAPPEDEPTPEPASEPVPPDGSPNG